MSKTPDRREGPLYEEGIYMDEAAVHPTVNGELRYVVGVGWRFFEEGLEKGLTGTGISETTHKTLRQLIHFIDDGPAEGFLSGAYKETTPTGPFPTSIVWWESAAKLKKIVERLVTWTGAFPTQDQWKMYADDGVTVVATVTDTIIYSGAFEANRTRTSS